MPPKELKELIAEVSQERLAICKGCEFNSTKGEIKTFSYCECCGCPLQAKTKALSEDCGLTEWNKNHPDDQRELKWHALASVQEDKQIQKEVDEKKDE